MLYWSGDEAMAIAHKEKVVLVTGYGADIGCWGGGRLVLFGWLLRWGPLEQW